MSYTLKAMRAEIRKRCYPDTTTERCSGRSTAIALATIAEAMKSPGSSVRIKDHHPSAEADHHLRSMITDYIDRLGFSGFTIERAACWLRFDIDGAAKPRSSRSKTGPARAKRR